MKGVDCSWDVMNNLFFHQWLANWRELHHLLGLKHRMITYLGNRIVSGLYCFALNRPRTTWKWDFLANSINTSVESLIQHTLVKPKPLIKNNNCILLPQMQPLICVGHSVHYWVYCAINKGDFLRMRFCRRHTFASIWGACLRFASLWCADSRGDSCVRGVHLSKRFAKVWYSSWSVHLLKSLLNLCKAYIDLCLLNPPKHSFFRNMPLKFTLD